MKNVLIIQANYQFIPNVGGELNKLIATKTKEILELKGYNVSLNDITQKYNPIDEVKKILDNDLSFFNILFDDLIHHEN